MRTLRLALALALVVLVATGAACAEPPQELVLWHAYRGAEEVALDRVVAEWERETGRRVTVLAVPFEAYLAKLEAAIPRGHGPDVFLGPHNRLGEYLRHHLVAPVGDAFPDADVSTYEDTAVRGVTFEGQRYGVPLAEKCIALFYDTRRFAAPPESLDAIARTRTTLAPSAWPLAYEAASPYFHAAILHAYGGRFFDGGFTMIGPNAERSLAYVAGLVRAHAIPDEASGDEVRRLFLSGQASAVLSGSGLAAEVGAAVPYRIVAIPPIEGVGRPRPYLTVEAAFLTPRGAATDAARALARALGSEASAEIRATLGRQVPATRAVWQKAQDSELTVFHQAAQDAVLMPVDLAMNPAWAPAQQAIRKVLRGDASPAEALAEAKSRYEDVVRPPPASASPLPVVVVLGVALLGAALAIVRRVREPGFRRELLASRPVYLYVAHAAVTIVVLVVLPLLAGAATSLFAGSREESRFVGFANYLDILSARGKPLLSHGSFYFTLVVTVAWTVANVTLHLAIGLVLGLLLARPLLRLRAVYRVLLVLPWAVPSYVTALAWKGMFHKQFGAVNTLLAAVGVAPVSWFSKFSTAFAANVATNVWLGFPFMMVVVMGALTSIPKDVLEAAEVDGATRWQVFRSVTLPLLRPTLLPAVVLGSVWTFNMFNVVFLVSGGEPDGTTDILVSEAYRWAFARNAQLGYAAAYAVLIFGLLVLMSRVLDRLAGGREQR